MQDLTPDLMEKDHLEILPEDIRGKFDLVLEGHDALRKEIQDARRELGDKISLVDFKVETVATDLKAHRVDNGRLICQKALNL